MYCYGGTVELAGKVFDEMSQRDLVSWNAILDRYGEFDIAHRLFDAILERKDVSSNVMLGGSGGARGRG